MSHRAECESVFSDFVQAVGARQAAHPDWRYGQTVFNVLYYDGFDPEYANEIRGTDLDPFYNDGRADALLDKLEQRWA